MEALQYIYTSWKNGESAEKGYMIYSCSKGISESECSAIKSAMQYLAPKELTLTPTLQEIADVFPYAFAYFVLPTGRGCVAQTTYLGKDYSGRYGNYIIYALIFDINELPCRPAEFFAESYIKTAMTQEELDAPSPVPPLPPLQISEYGTVINDEQLNEFLFDKEDELAQLISMILASQDAGIPFYLNDSRENLVLWSAAVQRILPFRLAKRFMFNTYVGDHESMRSQRAREEGLNFHLIGVRPDANYFNYATECKSNRQFVMDFIGGYMTQGVIPNRYAQAMAASIAFDCEEVDCFGEFIETTSFNEINGHLQDAYLYYDLLKHDEFEFTENDLKSVLLFGSMYCSESDNADVGSKLLVKYQEGGWKLDIEVLKLFWQFVCRYSSFMIFTLYELFTEAIYEHAAKATEPCAKLELLLQTIKNETPQQYREYLNYMNSENCVDHLLMYLSGNNNLFTNSFYIRWLLRSYSFTGGMSKDQAISRLLQALLRNLTFIKGCEAQMIEILLATSENRALFENILNVFMASFCEPSQLEKLCLKYVEVADTLTDKQITRFEQLLLEIPGAAPIVTRLCTRKIALSKNPQDEFWRFYDSQYSNIAGNPEFAIDPMILVCVKNVEAKKRADVTIDILRKIDDTLIHEDETIDILTDIVNDCSVKTLAKMDRDFLQRVYHLRGKADETGLEKVKAVFVGRILTESKGKRKQSVNLFDVFKQTDISLMHIDKADYEVYIKNYFADYLALVQASEDISALMKVMYNDHYFSSFVEEYVYLLKKKEKKENERWKRLLGWTCVYLVAAEKDDQAATELHKPIIRYMRSLEEDELLNVRQIVIQNISSAHCDYLFDEVRRKEGFSEKLGSLLFHKK